MIVYGLSLQKINDKDGENSASHTTSSHPNKTTTGMCNMPRHYHETDCHGNITSHKTPF